MKQHELHPNIKIWPETRRTLRLVSAMLYEPMTKVLDRLVKAELARLLNDDAESDHAKETRV